MKCIDLAAPQKFCRGKRKIMAESSSEHPLCHKLLHYPAIRNQLFDSELCPVSEIDAHEDLWAAVEDIFFGD